MEIQTIQKRKTESLLKTIEKLDEKYNIAISRSTGIDFGYGMRAYHRIKMQSFPEDKIKKDFENILSELKLRNFSLNTIRVSYLQRTLYAFVN
jgi:hypothetical protein